MNLLLPILGLVAAGSFIAYLVERTKQAKKQRQMILGRMSQQLQEIYGEVFPNSDVPFETFKTIWLKIASLLEVPAEKLRPTDRFDREFLPNKSEPDDRLIWLDKYIRETLPADQLDHKLDDVGILVKKLLTPQAAHMSK